MELRAFQKLAEARFFLAALARSKGALPRAAYYLSAATSALRSVTWVLKADLVSIHGARFESWWAERRTHLSTSGIGFALLTEVRNESTKTGSPILRRVVRRKFPDGQIRALEFLIDPGFETLKNFRIRLNSPMPKPGESDDPVAAAQVLEDRLAALVPEFKAKASLLREAWVSGDAPLVTVFGLKEEVPSFVALEQLRSYAFGLERLLQDASRQFGQPNGERELR